MRKTYQLCWTANRKLETLYESQDLGLIFRHKGIYEQMSRDDYFGRVDRDFTKIFAYDETSIVPEEVFTKPEQPKKQFQKKHGKK